MDEFINLKLFFHPMNWLTIMLMLIIAGIFGHLVMSLVGVEPSTKANTTQSPYSQQTASN